jgi:hypothetical protein
VALGDHVGFKLLGIVPALAERLLHTEDPRLAAGFFAACSWLVLPLLWGCARRLGFPARAQTWTVGLAAASGSLLIYSRHLLPYDASMALALGALYVGWRPVPGLGRSYAVGALAGAALMVYLGYWLLAGLVCLLHLASVGEGWVRRLKRTVVTGAGAATVLLAVWSLDQWGQGKMIENARKFSTTVFQGDFGAGWRLVGEYFWHAEGWLLPVWVVLAGVLAWWSYRRQGPATTAAGPAAAGLILLAVAGVYAGLVGASDVVHKFVVYGRTARQLTPFLCLTGGLVLAGLPLGRWGAIGVAVGLCANTAWRQWSLWSQVYPDRFREEGAALLAAAAPEEPGRTYYRYVNVDSYILAADNLPEAPEAELLTRSHPYQFEPNLYEGQSAAQRAMRRAVDHRMRLVRVRVPEAMQVKGEPYGQVRMRVVFPGNRAGLSEPLLSLGPKANGELLFVRYTGQRELALGVESMGQKVMMGSVVPFEPGRPYTVEFFTGALLAPPGEGGVSEEQRLYCQYLVLVRLDGREVLRELIAPRAMRPEQVYVGYNYVQASSAMMSFSGRISELRRGGYPLPPEQPGAAGAGGAVRLMVELPGPTSGAPEPLVVMGVPGRATLGYVRVLPDNQIKVGAEFWGYGAYDSAPITVEPGKPVEIGFEFPGLYPPEADAWWGQVPVGLRREYLSRLRLWVNDGIVVLERALDPPAPVALQGPYYGRNPVGGSWVNPVFTGRLLQVSRLPAEAP